MDEVVDVDVVSSPVRLSLSPSPSPQNRLRLVDALGFTLTSSQLMPGQVYAKLVETSGKSDAEWKKFREKRCYGERCLIRSKKLVNMVASHGLDEGDRAQCWYTWSGRERTESHFIPKREDEEENNPPLTFSTFFFLLNLFPRRFFFAMSQEPRCFESKASEATQAFMRKPWRELLDSRKGKGRRRRTRKRRRRMGKVWRAGGSLLT